MNHKPTNVIDLSLKYAVAAGAVMYFVGFLEQYWVFRNFGAADELPVTDPKYFAIGAVILFPLCLTSNAFVSHLFSIFGKESPTIRSSVIYSATSTLFLFVITSLWAFGVWLRDAVALAAPAAILTAALTYFLERGQRWQLAIMQQIALVVSILVPIICWFAIGAGQVDWRNSIQNEKRVRMQLLVSPDAIKGAQQMGIVFPSRAGPSGSAELSEPVEIMFQGGRSYGLRLNHTRMVRLAKDKVWGMIAETAPYHYVRTVAP